MRKVPPIHELLSSWNPAPARSLESVEIEDDTLRDGLQGAFVRKPTIGEKLELFSLSSAIGCQHAVIGFPASSVDELADCSAIISAIEAGRLKLMPWLLSRALVSDLVAIVTLQKETSVRLGAAFFMGTSPIRRAIENWDLEHVKASMAEAVAFAAQNDIPFSLSIEDASRTPKDELRELIALGADNNAYSIAICDTVGESTPAGAARLVGFTKNIIEAAGATTKILWHGHNDRGLAVANSLAAAEAGADIIGGSFMGIGERTGNAALEQIILYLYQSGVQSWQVDKLMPYCQMLAGYTETLIAAGAPLIGKQAFATCTGTHSAAILKARAVSLDHEDYVFSSVPASRLGVPQNVMLGPTSGLSNAKYVLSQTGLLNDEDTAAALLAHAKGQKHWLTHEDVIAWFTQHRKEVA